VSADAVMVPDVISKLSAMLSEGTTARLTTTKRKLMVGITATLLTYG
jgi:hypothetical protein